MKKVISTLLAFLMVITALPMTAINTFAAGTETSGTTGDCTWSLDGTVLTIRGNGEMEDYKHTSGMPWSSSITEVIIEDGVTSIGNYAFYGFKSLTSVTIPDSVTSIGNFTFTSCKALTNVTIPDGVTSIGFNVFSFCESLTSITIPDSVTSTGTYVFSGCKSLTSATIGSGIKTIGVYLFNNCTSLTSITIPDSVTSINDSAFKNCTSLTSITIPNSVKSIGDSAFKDCTSLTDVYYKGTETQWHNIDIGSDNLYLTQANIQYYLINGDLIFAFDDTVLTISGNGAIGDCLSDEWVNSITTIIIEDGVTSICDSAFYGCDSLTSVTISGSVTSISAWAFARCHSLTNVTILDGVTSIGSHAFFDCESLRCITIPNSVTSIEFYAFEVCTSLTEVYYKGTEAQWNNIEIDSNNQCLTEASFQYNLPNSNCTWQLSKHGTLIIGGNGAMPDYTSVARPWGSFITDVIIEDGVTSIGACSFRNCTNLTSVTFGDGVASIGENAFEGCSSLTYINVGENNEYYTSIDGVLFNKAKTQLIKYPAKSASSYTIPDTVTSICDSAFFGCKSLTSITIPNSVTSIDYYAFEGCSSLTDVYYKGTEEQWNNIKIGSNNQYLTEASFQYNLPNSDCTWKLCDNGTLIIGGNGAMPDYTSTGPWGTSITAVIIEDGVTSIGDYAFAYCASLKNITISDSVTSIGDRAFVECTSLTNITMPDSVTSIGNFAFADCKALTNITIPDGVTSIGEGAFYGCKLLKSVTIPDGVTSINNYTFYGCKALTSVTIPDGATSIGFTAFGECTSMRSITIPNSVTSISANAFKDCLVLKEVTTPCNSYASTYFDKNILNLQHDLSDLIVDSELTCTTDGSKSRHCYRCGIKEDVTIIPAKGHNFVDNVCTMCGGIFAGWHLENGKWAYYNNGVKVANQWRKDTKGWCFLGADGYMVTGTSVRDSNGWCLVDGSGYWITSTGWKHIGGCWYYVQSGGYLKTNGWMKDSKGWCFLDTQGKMVTGTSVKDSKGWCLVDGSGYWVTSSGWKYIGGTWYYVQSDGYLKTNGWMKDSKGWCFLDTQGRMLNNMAVKDSNGWCLLNASGYWVTGNHTGVKIQKSYNDDLKLITYDIKNGYIVNPKEYCIEIEEENKRHNDEIDRINSNYDYLIEEAEYMASYIRRESGAYGSSSSYASQVSSLSSQITEKEKKLNIMKMDTSGVYKSQIAALEAELERDYAQLSDLQTKQYCAQEAENYEAEANSYRRNKQAEISNENAKHEQIVKDIKASYNKQ